MWGGRNSGASFWLPSENEWYKAAYYDPTKDGTGGYWLYPTRSSSVPAEATADAFGTISNPGNVANYDFVVWGGAENVTTVGSAGLLGASYYGTYDQAGNVWEWNETLVYKTERVRRGGAWNGNQNFLPASFRYSLAPFNNFDNTGFRVAGLFSEVSNVPEPSTVFLLLMGGIACWRWGSRGSHMKSEVKVQNPQPKKPSTLVGGVEA